MGKTFESIARGLNEAIAHAKGKKVVAYSGSRLDIIRRSSQDHRVKPVV